MLESSIARLCAALLSCWFAVSCGPAEVETNPSDPGAESELVGILSADKPRHVLLIVIDTLRADHLGCYGYWRDTSPHMDALAAGGVRFNRAIAQSSWTSPSMITMMVGQRLSARRLAIPEDKPTLAELFRDSGFRTGAFVANPLLNEENGFHRGFDHWHLDSQRALNDLRPVQDWLRAERDNDTFTWVHFTDPHDPYNPPKSTMSGEIGRFHGQTELLMRQAVEREGYGGLEQQSRFIAEQIGRYDDEIVSVDRKVGELLATQARTGNLDNTLVIVTSDHGECLWQRNEADIAVALQSKERDKKGVETRLKHRLKQTHGTFVYQELVRVPLIFSGPGLSAEVIERVAESVSLPSTILALAGVDLREFPALEGGNYFGLGMPGGGYTMTDQGEAFIGEDNWKLILPTDSGLTSFGMQVQLYNLSEDPEELNNLAQAFPQRVAQFRAQIEERRLRALPLESGDSWAEAARKNAEALAGLGYTGGGFLDAAQEPTGSDSKEE